ncbi:alpha/beta hydrolase [Myceligenerans sp. I2]|uniref:Alpha/beta hydrolase n=2 Tax=Myceligenerans indicum TaxID=2593663 RepID=A0ABS1LT12_9MICO|nr:hypothetical protein [Myceligenerans indicum]MBL0888632.1 alpha/beta hydrolase [Myceligenerans indicum]
MLDRSALGRMGDPEEIAAVSALYADHTGLPPTLIFSGDREMLDSDARRLQQANPLVDHR